jgi:hypothetical protein
MQMQKLACRQQRRRGETEKDSKITKKNYKKKSTIVEELMILQVKINRY